MRQAKFALGALPVYALLCRSSSSFFEADAQLDDPELRCHLLCSQSIGKAPHATSGKRMLDLHFVDIRST